MSLRELIEAGVIKPPLEIERCYKGQQFTARIDADGLVTFQGRTYNSLSVAGAMARAAALKRSSYQATNGWIFWRLRDEAGKLVAMDTLRQGKAQA